MDGTFLDWWFHSLTHWVSPTTSMRFPRWKSIHFLPSDTRSSQPWCLVKLKRREGTGLCPKMLHVFCWEKVEASEIMMVSQLNSWLQFYDFNSLLQSSKIVLKVGEPSTKMLSTWSMDCTNSIFIKRTLLLFTVYWQFGLVFEVIWASLLKLLTLGLFHPNSNPPLPQTAKPPCFACFPSISCHTFCARWPLAAGRHQQQAEDQGIQRHHQPDRVGTRKLHSCRITFLLFLMSYQMKFNGFKWWIGGVHERTQIHII